MRGRNEAVGLFAPSVGRRGKKGQAGSVRMGEAELTRREAKEGKKDDERGELGQRHGDLL